MINKKTRFIEFAFFILAFSLFFTSFVSAENPYCEVTTLANCNTLNGDIVMKLSSTTNAHGANNSETLYPQVLCCVNFEEDLGTTCTGTNRLLKLSSSTNAHAESPSYTNYSTDICYEGFYDSDEGNACYALRSDFSCGANENEIIYLSDYGNAHLGDASSGYGVKICCEVKPSKEDCVLSSANWGDSSCTYEGVPVQMNVTGENCNEQVKINYSIYQNGVSTIKDLISGKYALSSYWTTINTTGNKDYYFNASSINSEGAILSTVKSNILTVYDKDTQTICDAYEILNSCEEYNKVLGETCIDAAKDMCNANSCNVPLNLVEGTKCAWNDTDNTCKTVKEINHCGNGSIEMPPEECDGIIVGNEWTFIDFGDYGTSDEPGSCERYSDRYTVGELSCNYPDINNPDQCKINLYNCSDPDDPGSETGFCGDKKVNGIEKCDSPDLDGKDCTDFGYSGGTLGCKDDCSQFDTSKCTGAPPCIPNGNCDYTIVKDPNGCQDDGFLRYSWNFTWISDPSCPGNMPEGKCTNGTSVIECPAEIPLPFFDLGTMAIAIIVIGLVYAGISLANKKKSN